METTISVAATTTVTIIARILKETTSLLWFTAYQEDPFIYRSMNHKLLNYSINFIKYNTKLENN